MSPATTWLEKSLTGTGWVEGIPQGDSSTDYFIDVLFEGTTLFNIVTSYTEKSIPATSYTENSVAATTWTERT